MLELLVIVHGNGPYRPQITCFLVTLVRLYVSQLFLPRYSWPMPFVSGLWFCPISGWRLSILTLQRQTPLTRLSSLSRRTFPQNAQVISTWFEFCGLFWKQHSQISLKQTQCDTPKVFSISRVHNTWCHDWRFTCLFEQKYIIVIWTMSISTNWHEAFEFSITSWATWR